MKRHAILFVFVYFSLVAFSSGQLLHDDVQRIYNFEPHILSSADKESKKKLMDEFWARVSKDRNKYLPELRKELPDPTNSSFFRYDGGHLLVSLSKSDGDYRLALTAMTTVNLADVDAGDYVRTMNFFAGYGLNTTEAALKIIPVDTFRALIPQHALRLDKGQALKFMLLPIKSEWYLKRIIDLLPTVTDASTLTDLLDFLFYSCSCEADSVVAKYAEDKRQPKAVRKRAGELVELNKIKRSDIPAKYITLKNKRKTIMSRVSDEALNELEDVTRELKEHYTCR